MKTNKKEIIKVFQLLIHMEYPFYKNLTHVIKYDVKESFQRLKWFNCVITSYRFIMYCFSLPFNRVLRDVLLCKGVMSSASRIADAALHGTSVRAFLSGPHGDKYAADAVDEKRSFINHPLTQPRWKPARSWAIFHRIIAIPFRSLWPHARFSIKIRRPRCSKAANLSRQKSILRFVCPAHRSSNRYE